MKISLIALWLCLLMLPAVGDSHTVHNHQMDTTDTSSIWRSTRPVPPAQSEQTADPKWRPFTAETAVLVIFVGLGGICLWGASVRRRRAATATA